MVTVRDPNLPMPEINDGPPKAHELREPDVSDRILRAREKAIELQAVSQAMGLNERPVQESPLKLQASLDIGQLVASSQNQVTELLAKFADTASAETKALLTGLEKRLDILSDHLKNPPPAKEPVDPIDSYRRIKGVLDELTADFKKGLGLDDVGRVAGSDLPVMLELEKMKLERGEQQMRYDAEEKRKERAFLFEMEKWREEREDHRQQWQAEFRFKKEEATLSRESRKNAGDALQDIVGAWVESVDQQRGVATSASMPGVETVQKSFRCDGCEQGVPIPTTSNVGDQVVCPKCNAEYVLDA